MADEVNQYAFEGGDTEKETAAEIRKRNEALQTLAEKNRETMQKAADARQEAYDDSIKTERDTMEQHGEALTGAPVITRPEGTEKASE